MATPEPFVIDSDSYEGMCRDTLLDEIAHLRRQLETAKQNAKDHLDSLCLWRAHAVKAENQLNKMRR